MRSDGKDEGNVGSKELFDQDDEVSFRIRERMLGGRAVISQEDEFGEKRLAVDSRSETDEQSTYVALVRTDLLRKERNLFLLLRTSS